MIVPMRSSPFCLAFAVTAVAATFHVSTALADPTEPRWFFSSGASVRTLNASFKLGESDHEALHWESLFARRPNIGALTVFDGSGKPRIYRDGAVGGQNPDFAGFGAEGQVDQTNQILPLAPGADPDGNLARTLAFTSTGFSYPTEMGSNPVLPGTTVAPSLEAGYRLGKLEGTDIRVDLVTGWTFLRTESDTGQLRVANVFEAETDYTFLYDYVANPGLPLAIPGAVNGTEQFIVYNPDAVPAFFGTGYRFPRTLTDTTRADSPSFFAVGQADLKVSLNEIPLGLQFTRKAGPLDLSLKGGLTLNILQYQLQSQLSWYETGNSQAAAHQKWRETGTPFKLGLFTGIAARLPLTVDGRLFFETSGSYRWVDPVNASAGIASVEIDPSSWESRAALGFMFD